MQPKQNQEEDKDNCSICMKSLLLNFNSKLNMETKCKQVSNYNSYRSNSQAVAHTTEVLHSYPSRIRFETDTLRYHQD